MSTHHHCDHHHHHHIPKGMSGEKRLLWAVILTGSFMFIELVGGIMASSLALLSDAVHMLTDFSSLVLALIAAKLSKKPTDGKRSYGYHRVEVLAAFVNGVSLLFIVGWIVYEAIHRLFNPADVQGDLMLGVAFVGLLINCAVFLILHRKNERSLNIKGAAIHVLGDLLSSVAAIVAALVILMTGWMPIDPLLSLLVSALILRSAYVVTKHATHILLEGVPEPFLVAEIKKLLLKNIKEIKDVHHIHVWSLTSDKPVVTLHLNVVEHTPHDPLLVNVKALLIKHFGMTHSTIQIETIGTCPDQEDCQH